MTVRLLVVVGVLAAVVLVAWLRARRLAQAQGPGAGERLPPELLVPGAPRTWVLVTAPMCAS